MPLSDRLDKRQRQIRRFAGKISVEIVIVVAIVAVQISQPIAHSGPSLALCNMDEVRGNVPDGFPIAACVDGNSIWLRNNLEIPIQFKVTGDTSAAVRTPVDFGLATMSTRLNHPDPLLMMPGDVLKIPLGGGAASATTVDTTAGGDYLLATTFLSFFPPIPGSPTVGLYEALAEVIKAIAQAEFDYKDCLVGKTFLSQIGCTAQYAFQVDAALLLDSAKIVLTAIETVPVIGLVAKVVNLLLSTYTYTAFLLALAPAYTKLADGDRTIMQSATRLATTTPVPNNATLCPGVDPHGPQSEDRFEPNCGDPGLEGEWLLSRTLQSCTNFSDGCAATPIPIRFDSCTASQCTISRTDGIWQSSHPITLRAPDEWKAEFNDIGVACRGQQNPTAIVISLEVSSTETSDSILRATTISGTYSVHSNINPPNCDSNAAADYSIAGERS